MTEATQNKEEFAFLKSPLGWLKISANAIGITSVEFLNEPPRSLMTLTLPHLKEAYRQLSEYFRGERVRFNLPLAVDGSEPQRQFWAMLAEIPFGTTLAYSEIAQRIGKPRATRTTDVVARSNPLPIVIPCHRVVAEKDEFAAYGLDDSIRKELLRMEGALV